MLVFVDWGEKLEKRQSQELTILEIAYELQAIKIKPISCGVKKWPNIRALLNRKGGIGKVKSIKTLPITLSLIVSFLSLVFPFSVQVKSLNTILNWEPLNKTGFIHHIPPPPPIL